MPNGDIFNASLLLNGHGYPLFYFVIEVLIAARIGQRPIEFLCSYLDLRLSVCSSSQAPLRRKARRHCVESYEVPGAFVAFVEYLVHLSSLELMRMEAF